VYADAFSTLPFARNPLLGENGSLVRSIVDVMMNGESF
jgi:hypothetical protein